LFIGKALRSVPKLARKECVGCGVCRDICPAKAIKIEKGKAIIDRTSCIRCFCCQEFCPKGAMKVKRPWIARLINK
jgi:formate hydrogenlyase subunit 6/NADH:ubiquinone oxidoreductase subunit I